MRNPSASTKPSRKPAPRVSVCATLPLRSDVADARQDLGPEQFERAHHRADIAGARIGQRDVDDSSADLVAAAADLLDDPVGSAAEADRQHAADIGRTALAGDVAGDIGY